MQQVQDKASGRRLVLLVLGVLRDAPLHGYAIARKIEQDSDNVFSLAEGLLYPLLHNMERAGLVVSQWEKADGRGRKVYSITDTGRRRFAAEETAWETETGAVRRVLGPKEGTQFALGRVR